MQEMFVTAGSLTQAKAFCEIAGVDRSELVYVDDPEKLLNRRGGTLYCVGSFKRLPAWIAIENRARLNGFRIERQKG